MCGFCGFNDKRSKKDKEKIVKSMADRIIHRGPDSDGYYVDDDVALGFRRLSIIDLKGGSQPIYNEDNTIAITFNGEIYNYQSLRDELIKCGHKFRTNTDTEVIVHGYEEWDTEVFNKLRGMYGIIIYDINKKKIIGARDIFGIKPFYYYKNNGLFMFASEIKSFLSHPDFKKELNEKVLSLYLSYGTNHMEETFFKYTYKLRPGHYFVYENDKLEVKEYFKLKYEKEDKPFDEYENVLKETIESSIKYHQISDVEVGSYLSGGVDSSYVVAEARPNKTFTVGFDGKGFSEIEYAKDLSDYFKIKHYSKVISADEFFDILPTVEYHLDEPSANVSAVPLYFLSRLARKEVKVVLSGEGADEMFGGYNEYNLEGLEKFYDKSFYDNNKKIELITDTTKKVYEVFSVYVEIIDFSYMNLDFDNDDEYLTHINKLKNRSIYDEEIELTSNDEILILQTCSSLKKYRNYEKKYLLIILRRVLNEEI